MSEASDNSRLHISNGPNAIHAERYSESVDVYSFGMVLASVCCDPLGSSLSDCIRMGFERINPSTKPLSGRINNMLKTGRLLPVVEGPEVILRLMEECLSSDPAQRPSFANVSESLKVGGKVFEGLVKFGEDKGDEQELLDVKAFWSEQNKIYESDQNAKMLEANMKLRARMERVKAERRKVAASGATRRISRAGLEPLTE